MLGLERLRTVMRIQSIGFGLYGIGWFFVPGLLMDSLFSMDDVPVAWIRVLGGAFIGIAWLEWKVAQNLADRVDMVWLFALLPAIFLVSNLWDKSAGTYIGTDSFFWTTVIVTGVFTALVAWARSGVKSA